MDRPNDIRENLAEHDRIYWAKDQNRLLAYIEHLEANQAKPREAGEPYIIKVSEFCKKTQECASIRPNDSSWFWLSDVSLNHLPNDCPIIVRDKVKPEPRFYVAGASVKRWLNPTHSEVVAEMFLTEEDAQAYADWRNSLEES